MLFYPEFQNQETIAGLTRVHHPHSSFIGFRSRAPDTIALFSGNPPVLTGLGRRTGAAIFSFCAEVCRRCQVREAGLQGFEREWKWNVHHDRQANDLGAAVEGLEQVVFCREPTLRNHSPSSTQTFLTRPYSLLHLEQRLNLDRYISI